MRPFHPRKYQQEANENIWKTYEKGHRQFIWTGATGCITGDSIINFNRAKKGYSINIESAFLNFNHLSKNKNYHYDKNIKTYVRSFNGENILLHEIENIVYSGIKQVYKLYLENGYSLKLTKDHKIMTNTGFIKLEDLPFDSMVMIDENKPTGTKTKSNKPKDKSFSVGKYHPYGSIHKTKTRKRVSYTIEIHRAIYEAKINGFSKVEDYLSVVKSGIINNIKFVDPKKYIIHHKDFDHYNNDIDNLQKVTYSEHNTIHKKYSNFGYGKPTYSKVKYIKYSGEEKTYDIICKDPYRNFVANKIVIHNSGKTIIGADITADFMDQGGKGLWLVHKDEISRQTLKKLVTYGYQPGIMKGNINMIDSNVFVAMVQTLSRGDRLDFLFRNGIKFDYAIIDEAHHGGANQWIQVTEALKKANRDMMILGLTATPQRTDNIGLKNVGYSALINGPQYADLLNPEYTGGEVYLTPPVVVYSPLTAKLQKAKSKKKKGEFETKTETEIFSEKIVVEDCIKLYNKYFNGAPCIIFGASVEDCVNVSSRMNAEGWKGGAVYDKMDPEERKDLIDGLGNGKYNFVASFEILGEGVDVPVVAGCIKRRRVNSLIIEMQQNGRPARKYPGKKYNMIIDQCGNSLIHGHPLTRRNWTLEGLKKPTDEAEIQMTICPACNCALAGRPAECPYCGTNLKNNMDIGIEEIKEVPAPMEIMPAPVYTGYADRADIEEYELDDQEQAIYNRIKNGQLTSFDRFGELAKMIGKDRKWTDLVWRKFYT